MKQLYTNPFEKEWMQAIIFTALLLLVHVTRAQEGGQGNTTIFGGTQMTLFGDYNFITGGSGIQPGVILTERAAGNFGILNFSGANLMATNTSDAGYVDGYVRKYGTGQFIFPVGDNAHLGQFAASADGTMGAYFYANPATAVTTNLFTGGNYPALPIGGPFPIGMPTRGPAIKAVSDVEYWDIDGANATPITLTWDAGSNVTTLTGTLPRLTIVGWNGTKWVRIPSTVDATSVLGGASSLTAGSITTNAAIVPNTYTAYTLAGMGPDLTPRITVVPAVVHGPQVLEVVLSAIEAGGVAPTDGTPVTIRIQKNPLLSNFVWNPIQTIALANGNIPVQNSIWTATQDANYYIFTTTTVIPANSQRRLAFYVTLNPGTSEGAFSLPVSIPAGAGGGDVNLLNNQDAEQIQFFTN